MLVASSSQPPDPRFLPCSQWFSVLSQVHASTDQEIREMHDEQANPQNAVVRGRCGEGG